MSSEKFGKNTTYEKSTMVRNLEDMKNLPLGTKIYLPTKVIFGGGITIHF